jgi:F-type H+-transporting ATPase subunit epsilon
MATTDVGTVEKTGKSSQERLKCVVVTPERTLFDHAVDFVALPLFDGELGVLPGRSPLIGRLGYGELRTKTGGTTERYFVDGGFVQVRDDVITVLTNRATPASAVDVASATRELEAAQARHPKTEFDQEEKAKAIDRARARLRVGANKS